MFTFFRTYYYDIFKISLTTCCQSYILPSQTIPTWLFTIRKRFDTAHPYRKSRGVTPLILREKELVNIRVLYASYPTSIHNECLINSNYCTVKKQDKLIDNRQKASNSTTRYGSGEIDPQSLIYSGPAEAKIRRPFEKFKIRKWEERARSLSLGHFSGPSTRARVAG